MDEIHDMIMNYRTQSVDMKIGEDIGHILDILDKLNDKVNAIGSASSKAANVASCLVNGIQPD